MQTTSVQATVRSRVADRGIIRGVARGAVYVVAAYLLGSCPLFFGTYPLGLALLCAATSDIIFIFAGLAASALAATEQGGILLGTYLVAVVLRILARLFLDNSFLRSAGDTPADKIKRAVSGLFGENVFLRMTAASGCAFMAGFIVLAQGGYHYYDLFGTLLMMVLTPVGTLLLSWFFEGSAAGKYKYMAGAGGALVMLVLSVRLLTVFGISLGAFGGMLCTLCIGRRRGLLAGCAAGFICGVCFDLTLSPIFVLAALADGLIRIFSPVIAAAVAFIAAAVWGLYMEGLDSMTWLIPGLLLAVCAYLGAVRVGWLKGEAESVSDAAASEDIPDICLRSALVRIAEDEQQLLRLSDGFSSLSRVFYDLSDKLKRPGILDLRRICDGVLDKHCPTCPRHEVCWGGDYNISLDMVGKMSAALNDGGRVSPDRLPMGTAARCHKIERICDDINTAAGELTAAVLHSEKIGVFALDYEAMSRILTEAVESRRQDYECSQAMTSSVREVLSGLGMTPDSLLVYGGRRKYIFAGGLDPRDVSAESGSIRRELGQVMGCCLDEPLFEMQGGNMTMTLTSRRNFRVSCAGQRASAEEGAVCGDSICMFETDKDYFYAVISDGMGSGSEAAFCSGLVSVFLEKMLSAGNRPDTAIKMLNGILRSKGGAREMECSATVDLLCVDLLSGQASVLKSGAAPTYVRRGGDIFRLNSETVPLGILHAIDAKKTVLYPMAGDVIIMVSDGVSDAEQISGVEAEPDGWLADLIGYEWEDDLDRMASKIIGRARSRGSRDDVSAVLLRVEDY